MRKKTRYDLLEDADLAEAEAEQARSQYLRTTGWEHTCHVPGAFWVWTKTLSDGRHLMAGTSLAVSMQQCIDEDEDPRPEDNKSDC